MTATQIAIVVFAFISLALSLAVFINHIRIQVKFRALRRSVSTLNTIIQREPGPTNGTSLTRTPQTKAGT